MTNVFNDAEFGVVIEVTKESATITSRYFNPDVYHDDTHDMLIQGVPWRKHEAVTGWKVLTGYSNQWSYNGPTMHPSEFVSDGMVRGFMEDSEDLTYEYVQLIQDVMPDDYNDDPEPAGWIIMRREKP